MKADGFIRVLRIIFLMLFAVVFCPFAYGKVIYVDDDAQADFDNIQAAINDSNDSDTVLVAPGTYTGEGNCDIDFKGKAITVKSEEGPETCIIDCQGSEGNFHRGFHFHTNEDVNSVLQGFTITNGYNTYYSGGAILCETSSPHIKDCIVTKNAAWFGGGIACDSSNVVIDNCIIIGNRAEKDRGGGVFCFSGSPHILGCLITENTAFEGGGGIKCENSSTTISHCTIRNNSANAGGGINCHGDITITNCFITGNKAKSSGGGIDCHGEITIINCFITGNKTGGSGGGIHCNVEILLLNCTIFGNSASSYSYGGGGIHLNAGRISNSIIYGNITRKTTGIEIAQGPHGAAGCRPESIKITNSVVGSDPNAIDAPYCYSGEWLHADPIFVNPGYLNANGTPDDPNDDFWVEGDYHLKSQAGRWDPNSENWVQDDITSPCIDAGDPNSPIGHELFPNGGIINMGAYGGTVEASKSPSGLHAKYGGGTGEPNNPYLIYTAEQLNCIGANWNDRDKHFKLMSDIDLSSYTGTEFNIIGSWSVPFIGVFDGNAHTISNFSYTSTGEDDIGLFAYVGFSSGMSFLEGEGEIRNLGLIAPNIDGRAGNNVGSLVGRLVDGTITGCYCEDCNVSGSFRVGGLVGFNHHGDIIESYSTGIVSGSNYVGGLVGYNYHDFDKFSDINTCHSTGTVNGDDYVGGLVGENHGSVTGSYSTGIVNGNGEVGGLVGSNINNWFDGSGYISTSYSNCTVNGIGNVGGLVGNNDWRTSITSSYSTGTVTADGYFVGGLVGYNFGDIAASYCTGVVIGGISVGGLAGCHQTGSVDGCYSTGTVSGNGIVGGLVGDCSGYLTRCFWDVQSSGQTVSAGGTKKTTTEMQTASTFLDVGWDFVDEATNGTEDIWWIDEGNDYPRLAWETE